jgi:hypothetical protein
MMNQMLNIPLTDYLEPSSPAYAVLNSLSSGQGEFVTDLNDLINGSLSSTSSIIYLPVPGYPYSPSNTYLLSQEQPDGEHDFNVRSEIGQYPNFCQSTTTLTLPSAYGGDGLLEDRPVLVTVVDENPDDYRGQSLTQPLVPLVQVYYPVCDSSGALVSGYWRKQFGQWILVKQ